MVLALVLLALLSRSVFEVVGSAQSAFGTSARIEAEASRANHGLVRALGHLETAGASTLVPNPIGDFGTDSLTFQEPVGITVAGAVWGEPNQIGFERDTGEMNDGPDNDGDGLIDEGRLIFTRAWGTPGAPRYLLLGSVAELGVGELANGLDDDGDGVIDEGGFNVQRVGDVLRVQLAVERVTDGRVTATEVVSSMRLRN